MCHTEDTPDCDDAVLPAIVRRACVYVANVMGRTSSVVVYASCLDLLSDLLKEDCGRIPPSPFLELLRAAVPDGEVTAWKPWARDALAAARAGASMQSDGSETYPARVASELLGLDATEDAILLLAMDYEASDAIGMMCDGVCKAAPSPAKAISILLDIPVNQVADRIGPTRGLVEKGVFVPARGNGCLFGYAGSLKVPASVSSALVTCDDVASLRAALLGRRMEPTLDWSDFAHLEPAVGLAARLLASPGQEEGTNILLVGPVGSGKTECAAALGAKVGKTVWSVGEASHEGERLDREGRVAALRLATRMAAGMDDCIILLDEAEDVLSSPKPDGDSRSAFSKVHLNRMLESNRVPVVWTSNSTSATDASSIRRMSMVIGVGVPNTEVRARIWGRVLEKAGIAAGGDERARLAAEWEITPALAASSARVARLTGGDPTDLETALRGVAGELGLRMPDHPVFDTAFDYGLVPDGNAVARLVAALSAPGGNPSWAMCIQGGAGTGKSHLVHEISTRSGLKAMHSRDTDYMNPEGVEQLSRFLDEARNNASIASICFGEASMLERAKGGTGTGAMLVEAVAARVSRHPYPVIIETRYEWPLDTALLQAIPFRVRLGSLGPDAALLAFRVFLGQEPRRQLPPGLAAGDFEAVRRRARALRTASEPELVSMLEEQVSARDTSRRIEGFRNHGS